MAGQAKGMGRWPGSALIQQPKHYLVHHQLNRLGLHFRLIYGLQHWAPLAINLFSTVLPSPLSPPSIASTSFRLPPQLLAGKGGHICCCNSIAARQQRPSRRTQKLVFLPGRHFPVISGRSVRIDSGEWTGKRVDRLAKDLVWLCWLVGFVCWRF